MAMLKCLLLRRLAGETSGPGSSCIASLLCQALCSQVVVNGLLSSLRKIGSILFLDILVLVIFAVIGTEIFRVRQMDIYHMAHRDCR